MVFDEFFSKDASPHTSLWNEGASLWNPIVSMEKYLRSISHNIEITIPENVTFKYPELISIGEGTVIEPNVYIEGPCIIGKDCLIRHGAYIRKNVILGDRSIVGHGCEIKNSLLFNEAVVAHLCYVGDSILGFRVNLGAGVKCSNLRLDRKEIHVKYNEKKIWTGLTKLGAILGDGVQVGCNSVLNPGTFIGKNSFISPLMNIGGYIPNDIQIRPAHQLIAEQRAEKILQNLKRHVRPL